MTFRRIRSGRYWRYDLDGRRALSVTKIISDGIPKPNLIDWAARSAAEYAADHLDEISPLERQAAVDLIKTAHRRTTTAAAAKGTEIHGIAQRLAAGEQADVPDTIAGYVDAYLRWLDDWQPEPIAIEFAIANRRWGYAGTGDELAGIQRQTALIDIKTGGSGVWPETCLQLAAYRNAEVMLSPAGIELPMPATDAGYALWLLDDGTYEFLPVESGPDIFKTFLHAIRIAEFQSRAKDDLIGLPLATPAPAPAEVAS